MTPKLTPAQKRGLEAVSKGHVWEWNTGGWGQSRDGYRVRSDVLDRLLDAGLMLLRPCGTCVAVLTDAVLTDTGRKALESA